MRLDHVGPKVPSTIFCDGLTRCFSFRWLTALIALAVGFTPSSRCSAQTIDLGQAAGFAAFAVSDSNSGNTGDFIFSSSTVYGSAALGAGSSLTGIGTIMGNLAQDPSASFSGVNVMGTTSSSNAMGAYLAPLSQTVMNAATTAQNALSNGANQATVSGSNFNYNISGSAGLNVITVNSGTNSGLLGSSLGTTTITINANGNSNEQFVFNFTGRTTLTNVNVVLTGGASAGNIFYNFISGNVGIVSSDLQGNVLDVINGTSMSIDNSTIMGSVMSDGFVDAANSVLAPELPTIITAGLACVFVLGMAGRNLSRRGIRTKDAVSL